MTDPVSVNSSPSRVGASAGAAPVSNTQKNALERGIAANLATAKAVNGYMEAMSADLRVANDTAKSLGDLQVFLSEQVKGVFKSSSDLDARVDLQDDFKNAYKSQLSSWADKELQKKRDEYNAAVVAIKEKYKSAPLIQRYEINQLKEPNRDDLINQQVIKIRDMYRNMADPKPVSERTDVIRDGDVYYQKNADGSKGDVLSIELYETFVRQAAVMKKNGVGTPEQWKMLKNVDIPYRQVETLTTAASTSVQTNTNYISRLNTELTNLKTRMDEAMQDAARKLQMMNDLSASFRNSF